MKKIEDNSQVLNLGSLHEEIVKEQEKKKIRVLPIFLILLGILLIGSGVFYNDIVTLFKSDNQIKDKSDVNDDAKKNTLTCTYQNTDSTIGLNSKRVTTYTFENDLLKKVKINTTYDVIQNNSEAGTSNINIYYQKYTDITNSLSNVNGLSITNSFKNNILVNSSIFDLTIINSSMIPQNSFIILTNKLDQTKKEIKEIEGKAGHICT